MSENGRKRWVQAKQCFLLGSPSPSSPSPSSPPPSILPSTTSLLSTASPSVNKSPRLKPNGWSTTNTPSNGVVNNLSPINVSLANTPVTPPYTNNKKASPRAGKNQKQIPKLKNGNDTPTKEGRGENTFGYLDYGNRELCNKSLGISVSVDGSLIVKRSTVNAWSANGMEGVDDVGSDNDVIMISRITAVRMSEEEQRVRDRRDKDDDLYYQFWKKETSKVIEREGKKVAEGWVERGEGMVKSGSDTFLSMNFEKGEGGEEELDMVRANEEVRRMRSRLLHGLDRDSYVGGVVSSSDGEVSVSGMDVDCRLGGDGGISDTEEEGDTVMEASWRRRKDLGELMEGLSNVPTPKSRGGVNKFLMEALSRGRESGGREEGFMWERSSMESKDGKEMQK
ncbi:hypothetical protein TrCOL_g8649 [Triparma columacea]|uniref:Uncharacterized protein n=1 Tax=Triparma columacea TaxID=722753 RepID=A0A9W7FXZ7_9STRA|nr:hypothetical protein TrCOL_g8649 [Triparma columacea]